MTLQIILAANGFPAANSRRKPIGQASKTITENASVLFEKCGQAFWITINRPEKRNAINGDVIAGIAKGYRNAHDDDEVRVIVLTGAGNKAFCAGADLQNSGAAFSRDFAKPNVDYADLLRLSQSATKPAIARVGGVCMAGMGLLCMTDMAVAAENVIFGLPEVKVGTLLSSPPGATAHPLRDGLVSAYPAPHRSRLPVKSAESTPPDSPCEVDFENSLVYRASDID